MKHKVLIILLFTALSFQSCKAQQAITPKVNNNLGGELDYTHEVLHLIQKQADGKEISLGEIDKEGTIHFNLPAYDIKTLFDSINLQHYNFQNWFLMNSECKDRDIFAKTPFDGVYSQKTDAIFIKKYGIDVAVLEAASDSITGSKYYWFYIDRAIAYKDKCTKTVSSTGEVYATISADIQFKKGWNFIEENNVVIKNKNRSTQLKKTHFTNSTPTSDKVKWTLRQIAKDEKIQTAKILDKLTPITKKQFEKWVPNKLGDLLVTTKEHGNPPAGQKNKNNIHIVYANKNQKKEIDLYVVDCAKSPDDMEMINFAYAMENDGKDKKDIKPYITQYKEQENTTQLLYKVEDRILVNASAVNINAEDLWEYIKKLKVEKLIP